MMLFLIIINFQKWTISAEKKKIIDSYESKFSEPYIDHSLENPPKKYLINWFEII